MSAVCRRAADTDSDLNRCYRRERALGQVSGSGAECRGVPSHAWRKGRDCHRVPPRAMVSRCVWLREGCKTGAGGPWIMARPRLGHRRVNASVINAHVS
jgi:hypothetical protein